MVDHDQHTQRFKKSAKGIKWQQSRIIICPAQNILQFVSSVLDERGLFMTEVTPGGVAHNAGVRLNDRVLEVNGESVEGMTHEEVVSRVKAAGNCIMFLLADEETDKYYQNKHMKIGAWLATTRYLPHKPRKANLTKGPDGYGFLLSKEPKRGKTRSRSSHWLCLRFCF